MRCSPSCTTGNSEPVAYKDVPETLVCAILAAEDSEFFEHEGIDFSAIVSAAIDNLISDRTRGARRSPSRSSRTHLSGTR